MAAVTTALVVAGTAALAATGAGIGIGVAALIGVGVGALTFAASSLNPEVPKTGTSTAERAREQTITTDLPAQDRRIIYGNPRVGAIIALKTVVEISGVRYLYIMAIWGDGPNEAIGDIYVQGKRLNLDVNGNDTDQFFKDGVSYVKVESRLGNPGQTAISWAASEIPDWTEDHKAIGICYTMFRFRKDATLFPNGVGDLQAMIWGRNDIYDPRTLTTGYTANNALCCNHFLTLPKLGPGVSYGESIDEAQLIASANNCDEDVPLRFGGTEKRYECNGSVSLKDNTEDILALFAENMAGHVAQIGGRYVIQSGYYVAPDPAYKLDLEKIVDKTINFRTKPKWRERYNTVRGIFVGQASNWQPTDFPAYQNPAYFAEDGNKEQAVDLELPMCSSHTQAQRIAKIKLERIRRSKTVSCVADCSLFRHRVFDTVVFDSERHPVFDNLIYRIEQIGLNVNEDKTISVKAVLRETSPDIFAWDEFVDEKFFSISSVTTEESSGITLENFDVTGSEDYSYFTDSTVRSSVLLTWTLPASGDYSVSRLYYKKTVEPATAKVFINEVWKGGGSTSELIVGLLGNTQYDFFVESFKVTLISGNRYKFTKIGEAEILNFTTPLANDTTGIERVPNLILNPQPGKYVSFPVLVTITAPGNGINIRWNSTASPSTQDYVSPVSINPSVTLYARGLKTGVESSIKVVATYTDA